MFDHIVKALKQTQLTGGGVGGGVCNENEHKYEAVNLDNDDVVMQHVTALKQINSRAHRRWGLQLHN